MSHQNTLVSRKELTLLPNYKLIDEIPFTIYIQNSCYNLFPLKNQITYFIKQKQNVQIKISELFKGPIHNLTIKENQKNIQLRNPIQFIKEIKKCDNQMLLCIQEQKLQKINEIEELKYRFQAIILEDKTIFQILYQNTEDIFNQVLWVQDYSFLWFSQLKDELHIQLLYCVMEQDDNCKQIQSIIINCNIITPLNENIIRTKNLVLLQNNQNQICLFICSQNFSVIQLPGFNLDIQYIEQSQDQYVVLSKLDKEISLQVELLIFLINSNGFSKIFSKIISKEIEILLPSYKNIYQIKLVSSKQNSNATTITLLLSDTQNSFMIKLLIDAYNDSILSIHLTKQIRNPLQDSVIKFNYVDESYLIFNYFVYDCTFFYDLQEERLFYDYIHIFNSSIYLIRINIQSQEFILFNCT